MSLSERDRSRLRDRLRGDVPANPDGSLDLVARACAVRGKRAG
jgi:hypothetical protein